MLHKIRILHPKQINHIKSFAGDFEVVKNHLKSCLEIRGFSHRDGVLDSYVDESDHDIITCSNYRSGYTYKEYLEGDSYDWHSDEITNLDDKRLDVSTTLFLNDDYEGGELELKLGDYSVYTRLPMGWAVSYPTGIVHRVHPVTKGSRQVVHWWNQSNVQNPFIRDALSHVITDDVYLTQLERFSQ
tara:strand:- start:32 stop:589 length:558 start_codon:yes stop_codon:yes gene_type:complete